MSIGEKGQKTNIAFRNVDYSEKYIDPIVFDYDSEDDFLQDGCIY